MKIDIELPMEYTFKLLEIYGYHHEEILVHYNIFDSDLVDELGSYRVRIAYKERPECLEKDIVMVDDIDGMQFDVVVNKLFNQLLFEKIF